MNSLPPLRLMLIPMSRMHLDQVMAIEQVSFPEPWPRNLFEAEIIHPQALPLCAITLPSHRVAGYICLWLSGEEAQVQNIAVEPSRKQMGVGGFLLSGALKEALIRGYGRACLEVRPSNLAARALYGKFGFEQMGLTPGYYTDNQEDALLLHLDLTRHFA
jgi:ribosomal-protein-alanine N-acetyltransferase